MQQVNVKAILVISNFANRIENLTFACYLGHMKFRTSLDMNAVQTEVAAELNNMRAAGVPMVHMENGRVLEVKVLKSVSNRKPGSGFLTAAE